MNTESIESKFRAMGARLKVRETNSDRNPRHRFWRVDEDYAVDIAKDARGQYFEIRIPEKMRDDLEILILQSEPKQRHLLLLVRREQEEPQLDRFLCGHDEREWFVAAVPGGASSVRQAMDALRPEEAQWSLAQTPGSARKRFTRKNRAFRRQGEWFFIPASSLEVDERLVLQNEPMRRGRGKPHMVEQLYRLGGETVWVCSRHPNGVTEEEYRNLLAETPKAKKWGWRVMRRDPEVYARGNVKHSDHATINLPFWHRVVMNTETQSRTMANVAFLD